MRPWAGIEQAIDSALDVGELAGDRITIEVIGNRGVLVGSGHDLNGTVRPSATPVIRWYTVSVRQLVDGTQVRPAGESALFHEFAQHLVSMERYGEPNDLHNNPELITLEQRMVDAYLDR